ncbi:Protein canopy 1 [Chionoecetes opilio]|uniref:Protein canopy 1 n=1 Tax=Chionoecetes opilio TaxID=41210 RepID=A0A8J4XSD9_CHIOP|nr:Protein canopy 1 [Chionoecetes opilio]
MEDLINFSENGAEGFEIRKEEVVTPKEDDTSPGQYERLDRMIQLEQEVERTKMALELLLRDKGGEKNVRRPVRSLVKPRDIRMLNLSDLQGIEAEGRLKVFFSQVESCSEDLEERKRILMARMDPPDKIIKTKLLRGLPSQSREKLEFFMDEQIPLRKFIERVETERAIAIGRDTDRIYAVNQNLQLSVITPAPQSTLPNKQEQSQELSASQKNKRLEKDELAWVKRERFETGTNRKLSVKWLGPYKIVEVLRDGGAYVLENIFDGVRVQRAAEQIKQYIGQDGWQLEPAELVIVEEELEQPPPRERRPVVRCAVCRSLVNELRTAILEVDPRKAIEVGSYRIEADGKQKLSSVKYAGSEVVFSSHE